MIVTELQTLDLFICGVAWQSYSMDIWCRCFGICEETSTDWKNVTTTISLSRKQWCTKIFTGIGTPKGRHCGLSRDGRPALNHGRRARRFGELLCFSSGPDHFQSVIVIPTPQTSYRFRNPGPSGQIMVDGWAPWLLGPNRAEGKGSWDSLSLLFQTQTEN